MHTKRRIGWGRGTAELCAIFEALRREVSSADLVTDKERK